MRFKSLAEFSAFLNSNGYGLKVLARKGNLIKVAAVDALGRVVAEYSGFKVPA